MSQSGQNVAETDDRCALSLGEWVKNRRLELHLSRRDVAERMTRAGSYTDPGYLSQLERGRVRLPRKYLDQLAVALEVSRQDILVASGVADVADGPGNPYPAGSPHHEIVDRLAGLNEAQAKEVLRNVIELSREHVLRAS